MRRPSVLSGARSVAEPDCSAGTGDVGADERDHGVFSTMKEPITSASSGVL